MRIPDPQKELLKYYKRTSESYDEFHGCDQEHLVALLIMAGFLSLLKAHKVLDVGTGTGRSIGFLSKALPDLRLFGVDLSLDLLHQGVRKGQLGENAFCVADASRLPFADGAFDFSFETGILHHVPEPEGIINEMIRVSRLGIGLSDSNMYACGDSVGLLPAGVLGGAIKTLLCRIGIWGKLKRLIRGREWSYSEGDGVFWTYSLYDSLKEIKKTCTRVFAIPLKGGNRIDEFPLLSATNVLVIALKE